MRRFLSLVFVLMICSYAFGQAAAPATDGLPAEETVNSFLQQTHGWNKDLSYKVSSIRPSGVPGLAEVTVVYATTEGQQIGKLYVSSDGAHAVVGDIIPFGAKPFDRDRQLLEKGTNGPSKGPKDAPVTIFEFGDLQCPACKAAQPAIEGLLASEPSARFVFQNFPLEMHNWAAKGAYYADCVGHASREGFFKFVARAYETQQDITAENADEKLTALAVEVGLNGPEIAACATTPVTKAHVDASIALGKSVNVTGTPTLFINGRSIGNVAQVPADVLKALVDFAARQK